MKEKEKEKKDNKEIKDLVKKADETASQGKKEITKEKPEVKEVKTETPKVETKPTIEKDPEKEALKLQVQTLTERVNSIEGLLKEASAAAREMQGQGQPQEGLTDEQQLEMLQKTQDQEQQQTQQGQAQPVFGPQQYFLLGKILDTAGKIIPGAMAKGGGGNSAGPEAVLKQLEFWTNIITKIQSNFISGLKLLPEPVRKETFKRIAAPPEEREEGIEE
ncbi:hypothetical protein ES702_01720 [subsurface metagenome]